jgi:cysteinyl-tRNA synthetase
MFIYDSLRKEKVLFEPIEAKVVKIYVCGPTVYDDAHLGHARSALSFDILRRTLRAIGFDVVMAKNFTDIDDKIINKVKETKKDLRELTNHYIDRYLSDMDALKVQRADIEPKATEHIGSIERMINSLLKKGYAYKTVDGDVYFDISKDSRYGTVSDIKEIEEDDADGRSRVFHSSEKRNRRDFALWKACGSDDICFDSSFGRGRPGWHIECSAMIDKLFDKRGEYSVDIHGGGADLIFPHHENEASQTRCATGHEIAKYWMHNGFVQIDGEKMSKSLGNSFFLKDALDVYNGELLRFYLISVHYRNDFNFSEIDLLSTKKRLDKLYRLKKRVYMSRDVNLIDNDFKKRLLEAMSDDLNTSKAFAIVDEMINEANEKLDENPKSRGLKLEILANILLIDKLLGVGGSNPYLWFQQGLDKSTKEKIESLISERNEAKKRREYKRADSIRDKLEAMGISLMDTPNGTLWEKLILHPMNEEDSSSID